MAWAKLAVSSCAAAPMTTDNKRDLEAGIELDLRTDAGREVLWDLLRWADVAIGDTHLFRYPTDEDPAVLVRLGDRDVVAFSQKCTHLGCVVYFEAAEHRWHCPCHEGNFDERTGAVLSGPPTRPLGRIEVEIRDDDRIWALGAVG